MFIYDVTLVSCMQEVPSLNLNQVSWPIQFIVVLLASAHEFQDITLKKGTIASFLIVSSSPNVIIGLLSCRYDI
jgi:hypothetical protein